jgi:hypothetical protein
MPLGRPRCVWEDHIKLYFKEKELNIWTRFIWLRIGVQWPAAVTRIINQVSA